MVSIVEKNELDTASYLVLKEAHERSDRPLTDTELAEVFALPKAFSRHNASLMQRLMTGLEEKETKAPTSYAEAMERNSRAVSELYAKGSGNGKGNGGGIGLS